MEDVAYEEKRLNAMPDRCAGSRSPALCPRCRWLLLSKENVREGFQSAPGAEGTKLT